MYQHTSFQKSLSDYKELYLKWYYNQNYKNSRDSYKDK